MPERLNEYALETFKSESQQRFPDSPFTLAVTQLFSSIAHPEYIFSHTRRAKPQAEERYLRDIVALPKFNPDLGFIRIHLETCLQFERQHFDKEPTSHSKSQAQLDISGLPAEGSISKNLDQLWRVFYGFHPTYGFDLQVLGEDIEAPGNELKNGFLRIKGPHLALPTPIPENVQFHFWPRPLAYNDWIWEQVTPNLRRLMMELPQNRMDTSFAQTFQRD